MTRQRLKLGFEALERRDLLAGADPVVLNLGDPFHPPGGNITAEVIDGTLVIRGDSASNQLIIEETLDGTFLLQGLNGQSNVNGQITRSSYPTCDSGAISFSGITHGIDIEMGDGDDYILLVGQSLPTMKIDMGSGDDTLRLGGMDDEIWFPCAPILASIKFPRAAVIQGDLTIDTADGNDLITPFANVHGNATIHMGRGDDSFLESRYSSYGFETRLALQVDGARIVDLGPDENDPGFPTNWHDNTALVQKVHPDIVSAFGRYAEAQQNGDVRPGDAWTWQQDDGDPPAHFAADERLQIEFTYNGGDAELISRLKARGLEVEHHSDDQGFAYASIRESDLALFANLPSVGQINLRGVMWAGSLPFTFNDGLLPERCDIDGDGVVAPNDALLVINALNHGNDVALNTRTDIAVGLRVDANQDGLLTPFDALAVINVLNVSANASGQSAANAAATQGEGEASAASADILAFAADSIFTAATNPQRRRLS